MDRKTIFRRSLAGALVLWAFLLVWTQQAVLPQRIAVEDNRGYAVQPAAEEALRAKKPVSVTEASMQPVPLQTMLPAAELAAQVSDLPAEPEQKSVQEVLLPTVPATRAQPAAGAADGLQAETTATALPVAAIAELPDDAAGLQAEAVTPVTVASGQSIRPLRFSAAVTASLADAATELVYTLEVTQRGYIRYFLSHNQLPAYSTAGWTAELFEEYYLNGHSGGTGLRLLTTLTTTATAKQSTSVEVGVLPGNYRLVISPGNSFSADFFTLQADFTAASNWETENNDTPTRYTELYNGITMFGSSGKRTGTTDTDADWYMLRVTDEGYLTAALRHEELSMVSVGWHMTVYDASMNQITAVTSKLSEKSVETGRICIDKGIYFICVQGHVYAGIPYALTVQCTGASGYEHEYNDSFATATALVSGEGKHGVMDVRGAGIDRDYFSLTLPAAGFVTVSFSHATDTKDRDGWNISLLDEDGTVLYTALSNWTEATVASPEIGLAAGTYYICIDSDGLYFNQSVYTVLAQFTQDSNRETEPNNSFAAATPLPLNRRLQGSLLQQGLAVDADWYSFRLTGMEDVQITFTHTAGTLNREGWIFRLVGEDGTVYSPLDAYGNPVTAADGSPLAAMSVNWSTASVTARYTLREGTYCVAVETGLYYSPSTYGITLAVG